MNSDAAQDQTFTDKQIFQVQQQIQAYKLLIR